MTRISCTSCFTNCQTNYDLGFMEDRKFQGDLQISYGQSLVSNFPSRTKNLATELENSNKSAIELSIESSISLDFVHLKETFFVKDCLKKCNILF